MNRVLPPQLTQFVIPTRVLSLPPGNYPWQLKNRTTTVTARCIQGLQFRTWTYLKTVNLWKYVCTLLLFQNKFSFGTIHKLTPWIQDLLATLPLAIRFQKTLPSPINITNTCQFVGGFQPHSYTCTSHTMF